MDILQTFWFWKRSTGLHCVQIWKVVLVYATLQTFLLKKRFVLFIDCLYLFFFYGKGPGKRQYATYLFIYCIEMVLSALMARRRRIPSVYSMHHGSKVIIIQMIPQWRIFSVIWDAKKVPPLMATFYYTF